MTRRPSPGEAYAVGYGKPPAHTRFQPGQSGNPAGRPKGARNLRTDLEDVRSRQIVITENGKSRKVSVQNAALLQVATKAVKGDLRASEQLMRLIERHLPDETEAAPPQSPPLSPAESAILTEFLQLQSSPGGDNEDDNTD